MASDKEKIKELEETLGECQAKLSEQQELLKTLCFPPLAYAMVVNNESKTELPKETDMGPMMTIDMGNNDIREIVRPKVKVKNGDMIIISPKTSQFITMAGIPEGNMIVSVKKQLDDERCEVMYNSEPVIVKVNGHNINEGDRVIINDRFRIITGKMPAENDFNIESDMEVSWENIGGLSDAKKIMRDIIELPHKHPDIFKYYKKRIPKGVLLYGPPGCGKTLLGKAVATSVKKIHNVKERGGFKYIKGPEILNKYVGESEATIRHIFAEARAYKRKTNAPAVIFIDEAESILNRRGSGRSSDVDRTIVPMFLAEMDGLNEQSTIVILATNKENSLDPAAVRDGRIDYKVKIGRPDKVCSMEIFSIYIRELPLSNGDSVEELSKIAANDMFSEERALYRLKNNDDIIHFHMGHIINGGMIASIVNRATSFALSRDLEKGKKTGLSKDDLIKSIESSFIQNVGMAHKEELDEFMSDEGIKNAKIQKVKL